LREASGDTMVEPEARERTMDPEEARW